MNLVPRKSDKYGLKMNERLRKWQRIGDESGSDRTQMQVGIVQAEIG
jgi:hypothetical protein